MYIFIYLLQTTVYFSTESILENVKFFNYMVKKIFFFHIIECTDFSSFAHIVLL